MHNFSAGPSIFPNSVIKKASNGILNINDSGLSLLEKEKNMVLANLILKDIPPQWHQCLVLVLMQSPLRGFTKTPRYLKN